MIDGPVRIGARTRILAGAYLTGRTQLGADNVVHPGAVIGHEPQDLAYAGAPTGLRIGDRNVFREHTEVHRGTQPETWTEIGDDNYLMSQVHVGHNCRLGHRVIMATGAVLGGHVVVDDQAFISGNCVVHQHCRVGQLAIMRGLSRASRDVPPFAIMDETHTVRDFCKMAFDHVGLDYQDYVVQDERYMRPAEVDLLVGDSRKARKTLGWKPEVSFPELVAMMVEADLALLKGQ